MEHLLINNLFSGTDSPFRETSNVYDGSAVTADMAVKIVLEILSVVQPGLHCITVAVWDGARL